jgi:GT2 family glycosyltransferase
MNSGDSRDVVPELSDRLAELERERRRLEDLTVAYRVVERSKFAQLRFLGADARALVARGRAEQRLARVAAQGKPQPQGKLPARPGTAVAAVLERLIDQVTLLRSAYLDARDALEAERAREYGDDPYAAWMRTFGPREIDFQRMREVVELLGRRPLFSVVMATYDTPEPFLRAAIDSVRAQIYPDWELCIADDASSDPSVRRVLSEYAALDPRIKTVFRRENGHIARAMNSALEIASGEFVGLLDHDDQISIDALFECALIANRVPDVDMIYSDEDKIDESGKRREPFFKPEWNPDTFLSRMYTCHFGVYRRALVEELGGMRPGFDGSQDYDLVLRLMERTDRIHRIPKVLYHWRVHPGSTASSGSVKPYAAAAAERAIAEALVRRGEPGKVKMRADSPGVYIVRYEIRQAQKVSVIIPTRNHGEDVDRCLNSIFAKTTYKDFEIIILDNGSDEKASLQTLEKWSKRERRVKVIRHDVPFNFSHINNYAVARSSGHYVLLLNNDTEVITPDWMEAMVEQAQRPTIGAVGALLLYPDASVQHAGVIVGLGGVAGHSHKHFPRQAPGYFFTLRAINNFSAVTAACLMIRRSVYDQVGGLNENLGVAFNDVDFCLKVREAGYRNIYLPHVALYHFESKSRGYETTPEQIRRFQSEIEIMERRWHCSSAVDPCYSPNLTLDQENFGIRTH